MSDLLAFLRARLEEDEAAARAAIQGPWRIGHDEPHSHWLGSGDVPRHLPEHCQRIVYGQSPIRRDARVQVSDLSMAWQPEENARHITRWDPGRVLTEITAKRQIIREQERALQFLPAATSACPGNPRCSCLHCLVVHALANPYVDHPDFDPAWNQG